ncbi:2-hydroxyacyl-CoA dehydratase subunit D [Anaerosacchariphilus polymeriproducens]|uniref:2-hydroxyacyl-CoA dehydratase n=1 Tax=Anaerosacchariphilus polymeriproducens TaxID=1812858 RepID=A0A371AZL3_9FIRM|nr:2-hydroxyacyl-CoA dehydratase family protein [Anaerosacchariphilus polymeriproducens]RDU24996.1 2-hydroxyacyl-CoA dehydratase [Anaerosacchariphilus polymeriproducens]
MDNAMKSPSIDQCLEERQKERFLNKSRQLAVKYLNKLEELPGTPNNFTYFRKILKKAFIENDTFIRSTNEKIIGTYCVMVPQEIIYAAGARPVQLCSGNYAGVHFGDDIVPRDSCPLVKAVVGNNMVSGSSIYDDCSMYIVPITCDCKKKMAGILKDYKETLELHVPINKLDDTGMDYYVKELYIMMEKIGRITGKKVTRIDLEHQIDEMAVVQDEIYRFIQLKGNRNLLIRGSHAMAVMNSFSYDDKTCWAANLKLLNNELEVKLKQKNYITKKKLPRILITGSPIAFPNLKIPLLIEEMGGVVVADETCMGDRGLYDPVAVCDTSMDGLMRALANRYVLPCSCPIFTENRQRIERIKQMVHDYQVDGVIYHVLRGCLVYDFEYQEMEKVLGELGISMIRVESDYNEEDVEQIKIRMEAFVEMIKFR